MNKNLIKILALSALVLSIGACNKNGGSSSSEPGPGPSSSDSDTEPVGPVELTLKEVFALENGNFVNANKEVTVKDLMVTGQYGSTLLVGYGSTGQSYYLSDVQGFEVEPVEFPQWKNAHGRNAEVNVTGTLTDVNGRPVLKNASVEVVAERPDSKYTGCPYISKEYMDREYWNEMGRTQHLALAEGVYQIASLPQNPITVESNSEFKVVFPAENTDATDSSNEFLIRCLIPAGLTESAVAWYNAFFFGGTVGTGESAVTYTALSQDDFILLNAFTYFDRPTGGMGLLCDSAFGPGYSEVIPEDERPVIIKNFSQIKALYDPKYQTALPEIGCEAEGTFSYVINDKFGSSVESVFENASFVLVDHNEAGPLVITYNCGMMKTDDVFAAIGTKAVAAGYEKDTTIEFEDADEEAVYVKKSADKVIAEVYVKFGADNKSIDVWYFAYRNTYQDVANFAAAVEIVEGKIAVARQVESFTSNIPGLGDELSAKLESARASWQSEDMFAEQGFATFMITPTFQADTFADDNAYIAFFNAYAASLVAAGFVADYELVSISEGAISGYFNQAKGLFVFINPLQNSANHYVGVEFYFAAMVKTADEVIGLSLFDVSATSKWTYFGAAFYLYNLTNWLWSQLSTDGRKDMFGLGQGTDYLYVASKSYLSSSLLSYLINYCLPQCATEGEQNVQDADGNAHYIFNLASTTEGDVVEIDLMLEAYPSDDTYTAFTFFTSEYTPTPAGGEGE